ncbi:unnamed protein product, partial [Arabidopsis halleri]
MGGGIRNASKVLRSFFFSPYDVSFSFLRLGDILVISIR